MVPVSILLVVIMLGRINKNNDRLVKVTFIIWLLSLLFFSPVFNVLGFGRVTDKQLDSVKSLSGSDNFGIQLTGYGEFLPRVYKNNVEINSLSTYKQYKAFLVEGQQLNNVCHIRSTHKQSVDSTTIKYSITCSEDSEIKLPISYSRYTKVINADTGHAIKYFRYPDDPRGVIKLNKTDGQNIIIELPTAVLIIRQLM